MGEARQESRDTDTSAQPEDVKNHLNSPDRLESDSGHERMIEDGADRMRTETSADTEQTLDSFSGSNCDNGAESHVKGQAQDILEESVNSETELLKETEKEDESAKRKRKWITVG